MEELYYWRGEALTWTEYKKKYDEYMRKSLKIILDSIEPIKGL